MTDCHVDWPSTLRKASFRGVPFWVETDSIAYGRRIETHQFPNRDRPFQEDLGEKAIEFNVTAYMAGDGVLGQKGALVSACRRRGPGTLVLPTEGSMLAVVFSCERTHSKDKLGFIAFTIHFGEAGTKFGFSFSAILSSLVGIAVSGSIPALINEFLRTYNVIGEATWMLPSAVNTLQNWLAFIDTVRLSTKMTATGNTSLAKSIADAYDNSQVLALDGRGVRTQTSSYIDLSASTATGKMVTTLADIIADVRLQSTSANEAIEALLALSAYDTGENPVGNGVSASVEKQNSFSINSLCRRLALMELGVAASEADFKDRREAIRVRAQMAQGFERELSTATGEMYQRLDEVRGRAAEAISRKVADIQPTVTVDANMSLPSLVWAYRLYADANKGTDLKDRNRVRHPAFMPASFEAETPETYDEPQRIR